MAFAIGADELESLAQDLGQRRLAGGRGVETFQLIQILRCISCESKTVELPRGEDTDDQRGGYQQLTTLPHRGN
jgi:hypothetical protein